jgi:hypothetical protein
MKSPVPEVPIIKLFPDAGVKLTGPEATKVAFAPVKGIIVSAISRLPLTLSVETAPIARVLPVN